MKKLLAPVVALATALLLAPAVVATAKVDGCDLILTPPDGAEYVDVQLVGDDSWTTVFVENGVVDATEAGGGQFAPGDYVATWSDGTVETFTLDCALPPDESPPPDDEPPPPDESEAPEAITLASENGNRTDVNAHCPGPRVSITFTVRDESEQDNGVITYVIGQGDRTVRGPVTLETNSDFMAGDTFELPAGRYFVKWDDEARIDKSYDRERFTVPECPDRQPPPERPESPDRPQPTLPPTDTVESTTGVTPSGWLAIVIVGLVAGAVGSYVVTRRR